MNAALDRAVANALGLKSVNNCEKWGEEHMNTCPNCGKVAGLHSSILQGCMCQHSMQEPPQRTWVGLTDEEIDALHTSIKVRLMGTFDTKDIYRVVEQALKEKNT
jgi:hypothetical protein